MSIEPKFDAALAVIPSEARRNKFLRFLVSAIGGAIPWVGPIISAATSLHNEVNQAKETDFAAAMREAQERKLKDLIADVAEIAKRVTELEDAGAPSRLDDESFLSIATKAFRSWDRAETSQKREFVCRLLIGAATTSYASDDVVRMFADWVDKYDDLHFAVIAEVHRVPGTTRLAIWESIRQDLPRDDSAEADLYRMLVDELSQGRIIRQVRDTDGAGRFLKHRPRGRRQASAVMTSAFDDEKSYVLTALGRQFVHYVLTESVTRVEG